MTASNTISGNGLILYLKTDNINSMLQNVLKMGHKVEEELRLNPNSLKQEFSLRDLDGYYITISDYHQYEG